MDDVIIIGGGPAGLNAALVLARALRKVRLYDEGRPRNAVSHALHGFISRDGEAPSRLLELGRNEIQAYGVEFVNRTVVEVVSLCDADRETTPARFEVTDDQGEKRRCRRLLIATGVVDVLPAISGIFALYGKGVHHCPYCDAWEYRGKTLAAVGEGSKAVGLGLLLRNWSPDVLAFPLGVEIEREKRDTAQRNGVTIVDEPIASLEGEDHLRAILLESGRRIECNALFFNSDKRQHSRLPSMLGCDLDEKGYDHFRTHGPQRTSVPGVFLAGDADGDVQFVIVAAAEGATAAVAINKELLEEDCR